MENFIFCAMVLSGKHCNRCQTLHKTVTITIEILYLHKTSTIDIPEELHMACVTMKNYLVRLGGDYMIPFCRDEILSRFAGIPAV